MNTYIYTAPIRQSSQRCRLIETDGPRQRKTWLECVKEYIRTYGLSHDVWHVPRAGLGQ